MPLLLLLLFLLLVLVLLLVTPLTLMLILFASLVSLSLFDLGHLVFFYLVMPL